MSFRKRNVVLPSTSQRTPHPQPTNPSGGRQLPIRELNSLFNSSPSKPSKSIPGVRPSPIDGRPTISTGTTTLDKLLSGHAGLPLGSSLLLEESGTTDFSGALLRYYAAEGIVQGHEVHVVGVGEQWGRELPGLAGVADENTDEDSPHNEKPKRMKIAWRYEHLGGYGTAGSASRGPVSPSDRGLADDTRLNSPDSQGVFCHIFDLAKRLEYPRGTTVDYIPATLNDSSKASFSSIIDNIAARLRADHSTRIHRLVIPNLLSPALYHPHACQPSHFLQFFHGLRGLLRDFSSRLTAMITLPLELYPRSTGLVRWAELLSDGVLEFTPFPHLMDSPSASIATSGGSNTHEQQPQGLLHFHRLPIFHEKGGGSQPNDEEGDLAFTVTRRKFTIKPFSLPPMEGDIEAQQSGIGGHEDGNTNNTKVNIDF